MFLIPYLPPITRTPWARHEADIVPSYELNSRLPLHCGRSAMSSLPVPGSCPRYISHFLINFIHTDNVLWSFSLPVILYHPTSHFFSPTPPPSFISAFAYESWESDALPLCDGAGCLCILEVVHP